MLNLKSIVQQLKKEDYELLSASLRENNAEKFSLLLFLMKEDRLSEKEMAERLLVNINTYYTLKSRMYKRIQDFLSAKPSASKTDILQRVAAIPELVYNTPRDTALALLSKLEKDLAGHDMPYELTNVYSAQKKLHLNSPKYYEYEQLYNRHVAYTLALDKAQDTLAGFIKKLGEWYISRDILLPELLRMIKNEMAALCRLYDSHHMVVYRNLLDIHFALFVPLPDAIKNDAPLPDMLNETERIILSYPKDTTYQYLHRVVGLLWFEYYHKIKEVKKEDQYFDTVKNNLPVLVEYSFCCLAAPCMLSITERCLLNGNANHLYTEYKDLFADYQPNKENVPNYLMYNKFLAAGAFYAEKYNEAAALLNELLNTIVFKNLAYSEAEIKLFLILCLSMQNKYDIAHTILKSVSRKVREMNKEDYPQIPVMIKILALQMDSVSKGREEKLWALRDRFQYLNRGSMKMLEYIDLNDAFIKKLSRNIK
jgi:hypothetical protein